LTVVLREIVATLGLDVRAGEQSLSREARGGYVSDLLSDVIANAQAGDLWITLQTHQNIVAVASMKDLAGIVLVNGRGPEDDTLARARDEEIPVMVSRLPTFELVGRLHDMGLSRTVT
jgi:hypothetical protein